VLPRRQRTPSPRERGEGQGEGESPRVSSVDGGGAPPPPPAAALRLLLELRILRLQGAELGADAATLRRCRLAEEQEAAAIATHGAVLAGELRELAGDALGRLGGARIAAALALQAGELGPPVHASGRLRDGCACQRGERQRRGENTSKRSKDHRRSMEPWLLVLRRYRPPAAGQAHAINATELRSAVAPAEKRADSRPQKTILRMAYRPPPGNQPPSS
jgi:hypothetical protein